MSTVVPVIRRAVPAPRDVAALANVAPAARVELVIESVVFHGFSRSDGRRATTAMQQELVRLVTTQGLATPAGVDARSRLDGGAIVAGTRPEQTGRRIARAVHGGLAP